MKGRAFGLYNVEKSGDAVRIFGESFQLDDSLEKQFASGWHMEGYVDEHQIEHIRIYRATEISDPDAEQWDILSYHDDEVPLELLMSQDDSGVTN